MNKFIIIFVLLSFLIGCKKKSTNNTEKKASSVEHLMQKNANLILENPEINSISIGVYKNGKTYKGYYGEIDRGKGNKANDNSIFEIASVTKTFTGYITAKAVWEGRLNLNDDIRKYLDGDFKNLEVENRPILIRDILTHTTGIKRKNFSNVLSKLFSTDATVSERENISRYKKKDFIEDLKTYKLETLPGKNFRYSGFIAPEILALILEKVYQKPYQKLLETFILEKAQMNHTSMQIAIDNKKHMLNGYTDGNQLIEPLQMPLTGAGGGLKSTVPDMLKYIQFLLKDNKSVMKEMSKPLFYDKNEEEEYGYFWMRDGDDLILHNGGTAGFINWLIIFPNMDTGFTVSFNYNGENADDLINKIATLIITDLAN